MLIKRHLLLIYYCRIAFPWGRLAMNLIDVKICRESGCPSWLRRRARFGIVDDDVRARGPGSTLASV